MSIWDIIGQFIDWAFLASSKEKKSRPYIDWGLLEETDIHEIVIFLWINQILERILFIDRQENDGINTTIKNVTL